MNNKSIIVTSILNLDNNDTMNLGVIPLDETWYLRSFGACDINMGDNKSSVYILKFGSDIKYIISLTGNTQTINIGKEFAGDGVKRFSVDRFNYSGYNKRCPFWLEVSKKA